MLERNTGIMKTNENKQEMHLQYILQLYIHLINYFKGLRFTIISHLKFSVSNANGIVFFSGESGAFVSTSSFSLIYVDYKC